MAWGRSLIRVLEIVRGFQPDGPGRVVLDLLRHWEPEEVCASLVALSGEGVLREAMEREIARLGGTLLVMPTRWREVNRAASRVADLAHRLESTHLHGHLLRADLTGRLAAGRANLPYFVTEHGIHAWGEAGMLLRPIVRQVYLHTLKPGMTICAVSPKVSRALISEGVPRVQIRTVPNGVNLAQFHPATPAERRQARRLLGIPEDAFPVLLTVGGLKANKAPWVTLDVLRSLRRGQFGKAFAVFCGDGPLREHLEDRARGRNLSRHVCFTGEMTDPRPAYAAADIVVHPSYQESFGLAVVEGLASGLPVAVRTGSGADEIAPPWPIAARIEGKETVCWTRSIAALAELVRHDAAALANRCRKYAEEHYSARATACGYLKIMKADVQDSSRTNRSGAHRTVRSRE